MELVGAFYAAAINNEKRTRVAKCKYIANFNETPGDCTANPFCFSAWSANRFGNVLGASRLGDTFATLIGLFYLWRLRVHVV